MTWIKSQLGTIITVCCLIATVAAGWGHLDARQDRLCDQIEQKADKEPLYRELDQIQKKLDRIITAEYKPSGDSNL